MDFLPLYFNLQGKTCVVIGGGEIAFRKAELLVSAGARLIVIAPEICSDLRKLLKEGGNQHQMLEQKFDSDTLKDAVLVVSATGNSSVNAEVASAAKKRSIPVNVVDNAELSSVIFPTIIDRSPIIIAASTGGKSPVLARKIREILEGIIPQGYSKLATFLGERRADLKRRIPDIETRRRVTEAFLDSPGEQQAMIGNDEVATRYLNEEIERDPEEVCAGEVYLVGAGPGDPDLLTLKALQLMQKADLILYDNLVSDAVLARTRRDARREYVGKKGGGEFTPQETINEKLVRLAKAGHRVLRLKGGDPFIFGRGGEEIESLASQGISFTVVPGITAASGCAAYAGIPLTHRDYSQSVRFVTGHPKNGIVDLVWQEFVHKNQTIVFYMGLRGLASICTQMIDHGRDPSTPVAVISKGTTPDQKIVIGDLATISGIIAREAVPAPTLIIVGEIVALHDSLMG
jgi:uroporphyrin-III C-methyltransferase/precorrin-2 dehydrogenase/sirohydrochlorin ferrochelatase